MPNRLCGAALAVLVAAGCGGSDPAPPPDTGGTAPPADGSTPPPSNPPATPDLPGGETPPPTDTPPTAGTPPPSGSAPPACAGLLPEAPGAGVAYALPPPPTGSACGARPVTDGRGAWIGVGYTSAAGDAYRFVDARAPGAETGGLAVPPAAGRNVLSPQPDGYHALSADVPGSFRRYDAVGTLLSDSGTNEVWTLLALPGGGSVLQLAEGGASAFAGHRLVWTGAAGERRGEAVVPSSPGEVGPQLAVSATGHVLVLGSGQARWFDGDGAPLTGWFSHPGFGGGLRGGLSLGAAALADGSVVVGLNSPRSVGFEDASERATAAPEWVTSRKSATLAVARGGRANAFVSIRSAPAASCEVEVEIVTPAGESCGALRLAAPEPCTTASVGADGTLFTSAWPRGGGCLWHWWSGLLR